MMLAPRKLGVLYETVYSSSCPSLRPWKGFPDMLPSLVPYSCHYYALD